MDGNIEKMQSLTGRIKGFGIDKTLTKKGMCAEAEATGKALATKVNITEIVDDLTSVADDKPLSANQGRVLKKQIDDIDPHYAENVIYSDTNVKEAIDKLSKAENISTDNMGNVQGALDELKGTIGYTRKNLLENTLTTQTLNGITYTVNTDKSITLNGTATADSNIRIDVIAGTNGLEIGNKYILSGFPKGTAGCSMYLINSTVNFKVEDLGDGVEFVFPNKDTIFFVIFVNSGTKLDNVTFYPMIRYASIEDDTYEQYVPSVKSLVCDIEKINNRGTMSFDANTAVNIYTYKATKRCELNAMVYIGGASLSIRPTSISAYVNPNNVSVLYNRVASANGHAMTSTINIILEAGETITVYGQFFEAGTNTVNISGYIRSLE